MFCILHITDLHRAKGDPISNAELISALISDRDRYLHEDPPIAPPQAIVVSGDIIQGVALGHNDPQTELAAQYEVAHQLLVELADRFLGGDRTKVVIVPGNHDIDWNCARASMAKVEDKDAPKNLPAAFHEPHSPYRWDWKSRELLIVRDEAAYKQRFAAFWKFFENFYAGYTGLLRVAPWADANLYSLDDGRIGLAAFNSCATNDCFAFQGEIPRDVIAQSHLDLQALGPWRLRIAVWHHDIAGPPGRSDYMDLEIVRGMIGRGYRLGLFGHQHRPQITPEHIYLPDRETMAIASAGSLCAGARELPTGARRGYSVIEIGDNYDRVRIHVREMAFANLFSRANLAVFGGRSYVDLDWTTPLDAVGRPENPNREKRADVFMEAEAALFQRSDPATALHLLESIDARNDAYGRRLMLTAALASRDTELIIALVLQPRTIEELVHGVDAHLAQGHYEEAANYLGRHHAALALPSNIRTDLEKRIALMQRVKS